MNTTNASPRSRAIALILCFFLGWLGAHRFYVGKIGTGILMTLTLGGFGFWVVADLVVVVCGAFRDKQGRKIFRWFETGSI